MQGGQKRNWSTQHNLLPRLPKYKENHQPVVRRSLLWTEQLQSCLKSGNKGFHRQDVKPLDETQDKYTLVWSKLFQSCLHWCPVSSCNPDIIGSNLLVVTKESVWKSLLTFSTVFVDGSLQSGILDWVARNCFRLWCLFTDFVKFLVLSLLQESVCTKTKVHALCLKTYTDSFTLNSAKLSV